MNTKNIDRTITEEQRQEFITFAREQGHEVSNNVKLTSVDIQDILANEEKTD